MYASGVINYNRKNVFIGIVHASRCSYMCTNVVPSYVWVQERKEIDLPKGVN